MTLALIIGLTNNVLKYSRYNQDPCGFSSDWADKKLVKTTAVIGTLFYNETKISPPTPRSMTDVK